MRPAPVVQAETPVFWEHPVDIRLLLQQCLAASLSLILASCGTPRYMEAGPSDPGELSRYTLLIQEAPDGQVTHVWRSVQELDLTQYPSQSTIALEEGDVVRATHTRDCEQEFDDCVEMCIGSRRGRTWSHASQGSKAEMCRGKCRPAYIDCNKLKELAEAQRFPVVDKAVDWLKRNREELLVGTIVVIAGVTFVVVVAGSGGAVVLLVPAALLVSAEPSSRSHGMVVRL
jgi:hypothetical protein